VMPRLRSAALLIRRPCARVAWGTNFPPPEDALSRLCGTLARSRGFLRVYLDRWPLP
jgi:hypothetical protein